MSLSNHEPGLPLVLRPFEAAAAPTGVAAAIANAVWHATGVRVRDLPITLDKILKL